MRLLIAIALSFAMGCGASTPVVQYSTVPESQRVEDRKLPESPDAKPIPEKDDWIMALPASVCIDEKGVERKTKHGVILSPHKAARAKRWQDAYKNIRSLYELDQQVWQQHRIIIDERVGQANKELQRVAPDWYDKNKGSVGFVVGIAVTIAIIFAVDEVK